MAAPTRTASSTGRSPGSVCGRRDRQVHPIRTGRLLLTPYRASDLAELIAFKADPRVWAMMLGGVRTPMQTARELEDELAYWASHDVGMWTARDADGRLLGVTGLHDRPDARGTALRMAFDPAVRGHGYAREAAGAVLRDAHGRAGLTRVVAVVRDTNFASRTAVGAIGMREVDRFPQGGHVMLLFESVQATR